MAVDIPQLFNEQLPAILAKNAAEATSINAKYQMNITGAGSWHLDLTRPARPSPAARSPPTAPSPSRPKTFRN